MPIWLVFAVSVALLICGYIFYGALVERIFGIDPQRPTPAKEHADGRDYVEMPLWKVFLVQLLNIAGLGPIFGPLLGALYGPVALLWIVAGCIFGGAVHDYMCGMLSVRNQGKSLPNICGEYLGKNFQHVMVGVCVLVLILTGMVFVTGPAALLDEITSYSMSFWLTVIFGYYFISTVLPIDKLIGKIYPFFGALLIIMAVSLLGALILSPQLGTIPASFWTSSHPSGESAWPVAFITIACGALSGFHSTQSPLMSRCLANEKYGRFTFYGAMIGEGIIAMIWVLLGIAFYNNGFADVYNWSNAASVTHSLSKELLGSAGSILAMLGVVILPVSSGDTAFRSTRLIIADAFNIDQSSAKNCLMIAVPLFATSLLCELIGFEHLWRYFGWANQTLAAIVLWMSTVYLRQQGKNCLIALVPAMFITVVVGTFLFNNALMPFRLPLTTSTILSMLLTYIFTVKAWALEPKAKIAADK